MFRFSFLNKQQTHIYKKVNHRQYDSDKSMFSNLSEQTTKEKLLSGKIGHDMITIGNMDIPKFNFCHALTQSDLLLDRASDVSFSNKKKPIDQRMILIMF